jgi:hypothetical protein
VLIIATLVCYRRDAETPTLVAPGDHPVAEISE